MLEIGSEPTEYTPYQEQTVLLTSDRPLTKWDKLEKRNGQWGWVYKSKRLIIDESVIINNANGESAETIPYQISSAIGVKKSNDICCISNILRGIENNKWNSASAVGTYLMNNGVLTFRLKSEWASNISEAKQFMIDHDAHFVYEASQSTFVPLSESEQSALNALTTYYPTTVLDNDQGCEMSVQYIADTKAYIDKKISAIQAAIVNTI